jgi:hypothetical protein
MQTKWGIGVALGLLLFAVGSACSSEESGGGNAGAAGEAGSPGNQAGSKAASGSGGGGGDAGATTGGAGAGQGGTGGDQGGIGGDGEGGVAGCGISNECGGCDIGHYMVKCSWGDFGRFASGNEEWQSEPELVCDQARSFFEGGAGGAGGAGGESEGGASLGGAPSEGICATYVEPGRRITGCGDCTETDTETKQGTCTIRDECCVLVFKTGCGV